MQLILMQDVQHLGSLGDEVRVKDGYARNYLLPRGMAIMAGGKKLREIEHQRTRLEHLRQQAIEQAKTESEKVAALELVVQAKAGASGKLFGSVTNRDIQEALAEQGYTLDRRSIQLQVPIKSVGNFTASVRLHTAVKVEVSIRVDAAVDSEAAPGGEGPPPEEGAEAAAVEGAEGSEEAVEAAAAEGATVAEEGPVTTEGAPAESALETSSEGAPVESPAEVPAGSLAESSGNEADAAPAEGSETGSESAAAPAEENSKN